MKLRTFIIAALALGLNIGFAGDAMAGGKKGKNKAHAYGHYKKEQKHVKKNKHQRWDVRNEKWEDAKSRNLQLERERIAREQAAQKQREMQWQRDRQRQEDIRRQQEIAKQREWEQQQQRSSGNGGGLGDILGGILGGAGGNILGGVGGDLLGGGLGSIFQ